MNQKILFSLPTGAATNLSTLEKLGAKLNWKNHKVFFPHPCDSSIKIYVLLDPVHMMKLIRNQLESQEILISPTGEPIKWCHLKQLHKLQIENSLRLGNKLTNSHIFFKNQKMKVIQFNFHITFSFNVSFFSASWLHS